MNSWLHEINSSLLYLSCGGEQSKASGSENTHRLKHSWTLSRANLGGSVWSKREKTSLFVTLPEKHWLSFLGRIRTWSRRGVIKDNKVFVYLKKSFHTDQTHILTLCFIQAWLKLAGSLVLCQVSYSCSCFYLEVFVWWGSVRLYLGTAGL